MPLATGCIYRTYNQKTPEHDNLEVEPFAGPCSIYHGEEGEEENREALIELGPSRGTHYQVGPKYDPSDDDQLDDEERITYSLQNILQLAFEEQDNPNTVKVLLIMICFVDRPILHAQNI